MMSAAPTKHSAYTAVNIETASQGKLVVMLFNGAIKRAEEAKRHLAEGRRQEVHNNLIRAQEIINELRTALDMRTGDLAQNLDRLYEYFQYLLIQANIRKSSEPITECVDLMSQMRDTWEDAFQSLAKEAAQTKAPAINQHGASIMNMRG